MKTMNGKRMRKRALSMLLACTMLFSCMDLTALAAEPDVKTEVTAPGAETGTEATGEGNGTDDSDGGTNQPDNPEEKPGDGQGPGSGEGGEETAGQPGTGDFTDEGNTGATDGEDAANRPDDTAGETGEGSVDDNADKKGEGEPNRPDADDGDGSETGRAEGADSVSGNSVSENSVSGNSLVTVNATNALGRYFAESVSGTVSEENNNTGCDVYEVTWNGREAAASFRTTERSRLIVGIYEEGSGRLAVSGSVDVWPKDMEASVFMETDNIPEYFVLRAFLVEPESARPLGRVYETEDYTRKMQEFYAKTTADFASEQVLNLDENTYNNFLVFSQNVKVIPKYENTDVNKVIACDEDNRSYKIENPDESIMSLAAGDTIAYYYDDNALIITKVYSITTGTEEGKTVAVILGEDADFESAIEFIKVGAENPAVKARGAYAAYADSVTHSNEWSIDDWSKDDGKSLSVNLKDIGGESTIRVFRDSREKIEKTELEISYGATASVECKIDGEKRWELGNPTMPTNVPGVSLSCKIEVKLAAEVIGGYTGTLSGTVGVAIEKEGVRNISRTPEFVLSESAEASVSLGLVFSPMIKFLHEDIISAALEVDGGVKVTAKTETNVIAIANERHACEKCFAIGIGPYINISGKLTFLWNTKDIEILEKDWTVKSCYYSVDHREFGWNECPYKEYRTTVVVRTLSDELVSGAEVNDEEITNKKGIAKIWLPGGNHIIYASYNGKSGSRRVIADSAKSVEVILGMYAGVGKNAVTQICLGGYDRSAAVTSDGRLYTWGSNALGSLGTGGTDDKSIPTKVLDHVGTMLCSSDLRVSAAVTEKGELYTWGQNNHNALGNGTTDNRYTPGKILDNVKSVSLGYYNGAAVTKDGQLYMWGKNNEGQLGTGTTVNQSTPVKILADEVVKEVSLGTDMAYGYSAAVTTDGKLYMWGYNGNGELGNGEQGTVAAYWKREPVRILEDEKIKKICLSQGDGYSAAVTEGGQLYMWGYNCYGQLGNATTANQVEPVKVLEGIKVREIEVSAGSGFQSAAIAEDGSLYLWGRNAYGQLGTGDTDSRTVPFKLERLGKVKTVRLGSNHTAAITEGGELYTWGRNDWGQLGDGSTKDSYKPVKILDDVVSVEVQNDYTAAVTVDGSLWMWGYNSNGQLGNGEKSYTPVTRPIRVTFPADTGIAPQRISEEYAVDKDGLSFVGETYVYGEEELAFKEAAYVYVTMRTVSYPENSPVLVTEENNPAKQTANFSGLKPQETYNVYVMKDRDAAQRFSNDNLLYLMQEVSGADGNLSVTYEMREACAQPDVFCVGMSRTDLSAAQIHVPDIVYDGEEHVAEAEVVCDGRTLIAGSDYELCGDVLVSEIGEYKVIIRGIGTYSGEKEVLFRVKEDDGGGNDPDQPGQPDPIYGDVLPEDVPVDGKIPEGLWIAGVAGAGYDYTGKAVKPAVRVYDHTTRLREKTDYTIAYKNHTKAYETVSGEQGFDEKKAPTIMVTGKGNYTGKETQTFKILRLDIGAGQSADGTQTDDSAFAADNMTIAYRNAVQKPIPVLMWNDRKLKNRTEYTVTYYDSAGQKKLDSVKEEGNYIIELAGQGNFTGTRRISLTITGQLKLMSKMTVPKIPDQTYTGSAIEPAVTVRDGRTQLNAGEHYTVTYSHNTQVGMAYVIITGKAEAGYSGTKRVSFKITGTAINKAVVTGLSGKSFVYGGVSYMPEVTLRIRVDGKEETLVQGTHYMVSWQKNRDAGTATVTFAGKGRYTGTLKKTFKIQPYNIAGDEKGRIQAAPKNAVVPYAKGGAKQGAVVTFTREDGTVQTLTEGKDYTLSYQNINALSDGNGGKQPTITIKGKGNFAGTYARKLTYQITTQDIGKLMLTAADKTYQNKKNNHATKVTVTDLDGRSLQAGTDYEKSFVYTYKKETTVKTGTAADGGTVVRKAGEAVDKNDVIPAGTGILVKVTARAGGNYTGTVAGEYRIAQAAISSASVSVQKQTYTGQAITPDQSQFTVRIKGQQIPDDQWEIVPGSYKNNVKKGTASVTIRGLDNYGGTKTVKFTIGAKGFLWWWRK